MHVSLSFLHPVVPGDSRVKDALLDVASHFLSTDQQALDFVVIDLREVGPRRKRDVVASSLKKGGGSVLQASGRNSEFECVGHRRVCVTSKKPASAAKAVENLTAARIREQPARIAAPWWHFRRADSYKHTASRLESFDHRQEACGFSILAPQR